MAYEVDYCQTKEQFKHFAEVVTGKTDGSPSGQDIDASTLSYTGQRRLTLTGQEKRFDELYGVLEGLEQDAYNTIKNFYRNLPTKIPVVNYGSGSIVETPSGAGEYPINQGVVVTQDGTEVVYRFNGDLSDLPYDMSQPFDERYWTDTDAVRRWLQYSTDVQGGKKITITAGQQDFGPFYDNGEEVSISSVQAFLNGSQVSPGNISLNIDRSIVTINQSMDEDTHLTIDINGLIAMPAEERPEYTIFNVGDFGPLGNPNGDHVTINKCYDAVRAYLGNIPLSPDRDGVVIKYSRDAVVRQPINGTGIRSGFAVIVDFQGATIDGQINGGVVYDAIGSRRVTYMNGKLKGNPNYNCKHGLQYGRMKSHQNADENQFYNMTVEGNFFQGAWYNLASEQNVYIGCFGINDIEGSEHQDAYALLCDSFNAFNATSAYQDLSELLPNVPNSNNKNTYINCRFFRRQPGQLNGYAIHIDDNMFGHKWLNCYLIGSGTAGIFYRWRDDIAQPNANSLGNVFDVHIEKNPDSDYLNYMMHFKSQTGNGNVHRMLGFDFREHDIFAGQGAFLFEGANQWIWQGDIDIIESTGATGAPGSYPVLFNPSDDVRYTGRCRITSKMKPTVFRNASDVDLEIIGDEFFGADNALEWVRLKSAGSSVVMKDITTAYKVMAPRLPGSTEPDLPNGVLALYGQDLTVKVKS